MYSKLTLLVTIISLLANEYSCEESCPEPASIVPCKCVLDQLPSGRILPEIQCIGHEVKDLRQHLSSVFLTTSGGEVRQFSALYINSTDITEVTAGTFGDATFHSIFFGNNLLLKRIDPNAFRKLDPVHNWLWQMDFYQNPLLGSTNQRELFQLINNLQVRHQLDIAFTGITEIPDEAFTLNSELMHIFIRHNPKLARIGKMAFTFLPNLLNLIMDTNVLSTIDDHAFDLSSVHDDVELDLSWNQLTEKSFTNTSFGTQGRAPAEVILWVNKLTSVPASVFRKHIGSTNGIQKLILQDNPIVCDCHVKWIRDDDLIKQIPRVECADHQSRSLYLLDSHELPATEC